MKKSILASSVLATIGCVAVQSTAVADGGHTRDRGMGACDVVSLSGTGQLLEDGRIVGSETLSIVGTQAQVPVEFTAVPLGALEVDQATGTVTLAASHDFTGTGRRNLQFTTFDDITVIPLGGTDASCTQNACGLLFRLKLETGRGRYNCGEIVSGFNTDPAAPIPFTSFVDPSSPTAEGDTVILNSTGKLCKCSGDN